MRDLILRYLKYGFSAEYPEFKTPNQKLVYYDDIIDLLREVVNKALSKMDWARTVLQYSGGFDSSVVFSRFPYKSIDTICIGSNPEDMKYSEMGAKYYGAMDHKYISHDEVFKDIDFKEAIIEMSRINRYPRAFLNDIGLYSFFKYIKEKTYYKNIASGKGIEFQMIGYASIYNKIIELAIAKGDYSTSRAFFYKKRETIKATDDIIDLDIRNIIKTYGTKESYNLDMVNWWNGTFSDQEIFILTGETPYQSFRFEFLDGILEFILEWFGKEYVNRRLEDYSSYFGINLYTPFIDDDVVNLTKRIPVELKKCINHHKYVFYQAMGNVVPDFICERGKAGLNVSHDYYTSKYSEDIRDLKSVYLDNRNLKIYDYMDFNVVEKYKEFDKIWALLNLSVWIENENLCNSRKDNIKI